MISLCSDNESSVRPREAIRSNEFPLQRYILIVSFVEGIFPEEFINKKNDWNIDWDIKVNLSIICQ